jgi:ADP-heptose:LPS heptosyltransferase
VTATAGVPESGTSAAGRWRRVRHRIKHPVQTAWAGALVRGLDRRTRSVRDLDGLEPRTIVVSRTDRIGDLLVASPLLHALHRRWPRARLVMIAGPKNRAVLEGLPFVEQGPVFRRDPLSWTRVATWLGRQGAELSVSLGAESMAGVWIAACSRAPVRMVTHATKTRPAYNLILGVDDAHQTTRYCRAAAVLGFPTDEVRPVFIVPPDAERRAAEILPALLTPSAGPLVGFQIPHRGTRHHAARAWPVDRVPALVRQLAADGCRVVLCGTGAERREAEHVRSQIPEAVVSPPVPLAIFAALQRRFDLFISQFTGTLHLADGLGVPTLSFGVREQNESWAILGPRHQFVEGPRVADISVETLVEATRSLLGRGRN